jgi:hypothetical protein
MDEHVGKRITNGSRTVWNTLEELRSIALARGCTPAQFQNAVETVGDDPQHVASYLHRHAFVAITDARSHAAQHSQAATDIEPLP